MINRQFELKTYSPLHIGSGNKLKASEFILDKNRIIIPNLEELFRHSDFDRNNFLETIEQAKDSKSYSIAEAINIPPDKIPTHYAISIEQSLARELSGKIQRGNFRDFSEFIKTTNHPYIPGSSIKGSILTAVINHILKNEPALLKKTKEEIKGFIVKSNSELRRIRSKLFGAKCKKNEQKLIKKEFQELEQNILQSILSQNSPDTSRNSNYSLSRAFVVGDSSPWPLNITRLAEVKVFSLNIRNEPKSKFFSIYIETIPAESTTEITIGIDDKLISTPACEKLLGLRKIFSNFDTLRQACNNFAKRVISEEKLFFKNAPEIVAWYTKLESQIDDNAIILNTGWGSGTVFKTLLLHIDDSDKKDLRWLGKIGNLQPFGKVKHKNCPKGGKKGCSYWGNEKWRCKDCSYGGRPIIIGRNQVELHPKYPKSRRLVVNVSDSVSPLGWVLLKLES